MAPPLSPQGMMPAMGELHGQASTQQGREAPLFVRQTLSGNTQSRRRLLGKFLGLQQLDLLKQVLYDPGR